MPADSKNMAWLGRNVLNNALGKSSSSHRAYLPAFCNLGHVTLSF